MSGILLSRLRGHPLFETLYGLRGNPRYCILTEPLWGIPYNLYTPFVTIYMFNLGVGDVQIGLIISISMVFQVIAALLSGIVTDKLGRRRTTFIFDMISWTIPCLIWAFARNFWWFLAAGVINSIWQLTGNSWTCLLVEEAPKNKMISIYTWIYIGGRLSVFFAPLAGILVKVLDVVPTVRILYLFALLSMTAKFVILFIFSTETKQGVTRMRETHGVSILSMLGRYGHIFTEIIKTPRTLKLLLLLILGTVMQSVSDNFFSLYVTNDLLIPAQYLAYFPIVRAIIMLIFFLTLQYRILRFRFKIPMLAGLAVFVLSHLVLILTPTSSLPMLILYIILEPVATALYMPWKDSLTALNINPEERAGTLGIMYALMLLVSSPFGYVAGLLSSMDRRLPFVLNIFLFLCMAIIVLTFKDNAEAGVDALVE